MITASEHSPHVALVRKGGVISGAPPDEQAVLRSSMGMRIRSRIAKTRSVKRSVIIKMKLTASEHSLHVALSIKKAKEKL